MQKAKTKKPTVRSLQKEVKRLRAMVDQDCETVRYLSSKADELKKQLAEKDKEHELSRQHLMARTELIKSMSWAMKACSSIMWSEKQVGWNYQTPQNNYYSKPTTKGGD